MAKITVKDIAGQPVLRERYQTWANDPVTITHLDAAEDAFRPAGLPPSQRSGQNALYYAGLLDGAAQVIATLRDMVTVVNAAQTLQDEVRALRPEYGAGNELRKEGIDIEKLLKRR